MLLWIAHHLLPAGGMLLSKPQNGVLIFYHSTPSFAGGSQHFSTHEYKKATLQNCTPGRQK